MHEIGRLVAPDMDELSLSERDVLTAIRKIVCRGARQDGFTEFDPGLL